MKTVQKLIIITFAAAAALCVPAMAERRDTKFYVIPEIGIVKLSDYCDSLEGVTPTTCEDSEIGFGIAGGYSFHEFISAEFGVRLGSGYDGTASVTLMVPNLINGALPLVPVPGTATAELSYNSFSLGGRVNYPIGDSGFGVTGKAGFHRWSSEVDISASPTALMTPLTPTGNVTINSTLKDNGFDFYGGIGANYAVTDDILAQGEYTFYSYGGDSFDDSAHAFTGSVVWHF